jgi:hypothetical protein
MDKEFQLFLIKTNHLRSALFDMYEIRNSLSNEVLNQPADYYGSDNTIGECLDDVIQFLESQNKLIKKEENECG